MGYKDYKMPKGREVESNGQRTGSSGFVSVTQALKT